MFHRINSVTPLAEFHLLVHFSDGSSCDYDMNPLFQEHPVFSPLRDMPSLFDQVVVDAGGYGISWNDDIDLDGSELWENGVPVQTPFDGLLSFSDATSLWKLNESTLRKAVCYGKLRQGLDVLKFGKQWVVTKTAMLREYGNPS